MSETLTRARTFLFTQGRDIDQAQLTHHFEGASPDALLGTLARYQNPDGGFTRLEVDIHAPASNPFATEIALLICVQASVPATSDLLERIVAHLERTQTDDGDWRFAPGVYDHELAPWFQGWQWPNLNPACTTAGLLRELGAGSPELHARVARLFARLANPDDLARDDFYAVRPYAFYFLPEWEHPQRKQYLAALLDWLLRQAPKPDVDGNHFFAYVRGPQTWTGQHIPRDILNDRLDRLTAEQEADGGWPSPYSPAWRGWITIQNLLTLRAFGRV